MPIYNFEIQGESYSVEGKDVTSITKEVQKFYEQKGFPQDYNSL